MDFLLSNFSFRRILLFLPSLGLGMNVGKSFLSHAGIILQDKSIAKHGITAILVTDLTPSLPLLKQPGQFSGVLYKS